MLRVLVWHAVEGEFIIAIYLSVCGQVQRAQIRLQGRFGRQSICNFHLFSSVCTFFTSSEIRDQLLNNRESQATTNYIFPAISFSSFRGITASSCISSPFLVPTIIFGLLLFELPFFCFMSKLALWTSLIMAASFFIVIALLAVLLSELYCSILRSCSKRQAGDNDDEENQFQLPPADSSLSISQRGDNLRLIGLMTASPSASLSFQRHQQEEVFESSITQEVGKEGLVYISNPIYDHIVVGNNGCSSNDSSKHITPFETPGSSPSRLETEDEDGDCEGDSVSPTLVPMKKLPLRAPSLTISGTTDSNMASSSSHSFSPQCTSPSL